MAEENPKKSQIYDEFGSLSEEFSFVKEGADTGHEYVPPKEKEHIKVIESVRETTGFDLTEVMKAQTYDAKVNHNVNVTGLDKAAAKEAVSNKVSEAVSEAVTE